MSFFAATLPRRKAVSHPALVNTKEMIGPRQTIKQNYPKAPQQHPQGKVGVDSIFRKKIAQLHLGILCISALVSLIKNH